MTNHPYAHVVSAGLSGSVKTPRKVTVDRVDFVQGRTDYANVVYKHSGGGYADLLESFPVWGLTPMRLHDKLICEGWKRVRSTMNNTISYYPPMQIVGE